MSAVHIDLPPTLRKLDDLAFAACTNNLRTVTIHSQLDTMGESVYRHANLDCIRFTAAVPPAVKGEGPLYDIGRLDSIVIPCGSLNVWLDNSYWGQFADKYVEDCNMDIGDHNVENVLAASAISLFAGIDPEVISSAVREFPGVEHRIEFCGNVDGVDYYNDSKGTNVDAAVIALKALRDGVILIAGGDGKSQDFTELARHFAGCVEALVLLGRDAPVIEEAARREGFTNIYNCKDMPECVRTAAALAKPGQKVLLSPACASWDMYDNFEQRGNHFRDCVNRL
jgi:UDP-N-acetylmuramoylalanine-D-glutamate ligase